MSTLVMKFGGTSVGTAGAMAQAGRIVSQETKNRDRVVVVVSALSGVTDMLIAGAKSAATGDEDGYREIAETLRARHREMAVTLVPDPEERKTIEETIDSYLAEFSRMCASVAVLRELTPRALDGIVSFGERLSACLLAGFLGDQGIRSEAVDGTELIVTDRTFQNAVPLADLTRARVADRLVPLLEKGVVPVVTGFIGATEDGIPTTLGRGGSDYTAAILGDMLDSDAVWIFTDVDGVMTADPRIVPDAHVIPDISYAEVGELAYFGAKVLHPRAIRPVIDRGIPVWVKNTFRPEAPGTRIVRTPQNTDGTVKAVTMIDDLTMINVRGRGMIGVPGIAGRTFSAVAQANANVLMISQASSEQSICFAVPTRSAPAVVARLEKALAHELARRDIDCVWSQDELVIITAVGAGVRDTPGVDGRIFGALGKAGINVLAIAQGSSECSVSLVVNAADAITAVRQIHKEVINHGK